MNCSWTNGTISGTKMDFPKPGAPTPSPAPSPSGSCPAGYSRAFDYDCQSYCGCDKPDGSPKAQCDFCCKDTGTSCERQPPTAGPAVAALLQGGEERPAPGRLAQARGGR